MNKDIIIASAKRTLSKEIQSIKTLNKTFNQNFYRAIQTIYFSDLSHKYVHINSAYST